jgi:CHASE1-domain containing sensor protein
MTGVESPHPDRRTQGLRRIAPVAVTAGLGIILSLLVFLAARRSETDRTQNEVTRVGELAQRDIDRTARLYIAAIQAVGAFFEASEKVEEEEFVKFTKGTLARREGIAALAWAEVSGAVSGHSGAGSRDRRRVGG